jgi:molecular chaperone DnaK
LAEDDLKILGEAIDAAKKVVTDGKADKTALESAAKELNDKIMPIGAKMYESAKESSGSDDSKPEDDGTKPEEGPVEGEVIDDKKE